MTITIDLGTTTAAADYPIVETRVYAKQRWIHEWFEQEGVYVDRIVWAAAPRIGMAQLYCRYGVGMLPGEHLFKQLGRLSVARYFCRIDVTMVSLLVAGTTKTMRWYGIIDLTNDIVEGDGISNLQSGRQALIAYGLEGELYRYPIRDCQYKQSSTGLVLRSVGALECNANDRQNRTPSITAAGYHVFSEDLDTAQYWSTRDIVRYVVGDHSPKNSLTPEDSQRLGSYSIPTEIDLDGILNLPSWDAPRLPLHGMSPGQVLNVLMARQRLLGWRTEVIDDDTLRIIPFTFAGTEISLTPPNKIPKNPNTFHIAVHRAADADVSVRFDQTGTFDQVIVEGAQRRSAFTVSNESGWGYTLEAGWTAALETEYEAAASGSPSYPASSEVDERRRMNAVVRGSDRLATVFSRFQLPAIWAFTAGDGGGVNFYPVFPRDVRYNEADDYESVTEVYRPEMAILPTIPLLSDVDYSSGTTGGNWLGTGDRHEELPPIVLIEMPERPGKYAPIETAGMRADLPRTDIDTNHRWSASVRVNTRVRELAFYVNVGGQPQHVIGGLDFSPLAEDRDLGKFDWRAIVATVAIEEPRRCYGAWPDVTELPVLDIVRVLRIQAGDDYRQDFMPEGTVLGIDTSGALVKNPQAQWINDARVQLQELARIAFEWYGVERRILELSTKRVNGHLSVGDLIVSVSRTAGQDIEVGTCITQISIDSPLSNSAAPRGATMRWTTAYAELDPLQIKPPNHLPATSRGR